MRAAVGGWTEWGREQWSSPSNEGTMELNGSLSSAVDTLPTSFTSCYNLQFNNLQSYKLRPPPQKKEKKK